MKKYFILFVVFGLFLLFAASLAWVSCRTRNSIAPVEDGSLRLVSTAPSITEILFDIGVGDRIVGDSVFTAYPPESEKIEKIGGLYDMNYEKIVSLNPNLAVCLIENDTLRRRLENLGVPSISVDHRGLDGVLESYEIIGKRLGGDVSRTAIEKRDALRFEFNAFRERSKTLSPVRVMVCVDRSRAAGRLQGVYVAGTNPFYAEVIELAGGVNVAGNLGVPFASLSTEGILDLAPDVIVELYTGEGSVSAAQMSVDAVAVLRKKSLAEWQTLGNRVPAVKTGKIYLITEGFATIPGPRTPQLIEKLASLLHGPQAE